MNASWTVRAEVAVLAGLLTAAAAVLAAPTLSAAPAAPAAPASPAPATMGGGGAGFDTGPGGLGVEVMDLDWLDQDRNRPVPVRIYFPQHGPGPFPAVAFSSGLAAGRGAFDFMGRHLASRGFIFLYVQHPGSDGPEKGGGAAAGAAAAPHGRQAAQRAQVTVATVRDPHSGVNRLLDLVFAIDQLFALEKSSPVLRGRIDSRQVAVGGVNVGAWTALQAIGLATAGKGGGESSLPDPRVKAALILAPPSPDEERRAKLRFENIHVPCLVVDSMHADPRAAAKARLPARRYVYDQIQGAEAVLLTFADAAAPQAAAAADTARRGEATRVPSREEQAAAAATAFLSATLRHDAGARTWLYKGGLAAWLGAAGRVETHLPPPSRPAAKAP